MSLEAVREHGDRFRVSSPDKPRPTAPAAKRDGWRLARRSRRQVALGKPGLPDGAVRSNPPNAVFRHHWILWVGPVVMLVAALLPWPYGY